MGGKWNIRDWPTLDLRKLKGWRRPYEKPALMVMMELPCRADRVEMPVFPSYDVDFWKTPPEMIAIPLVRRVKLWSPEGLEMAYERWRKRCSG